MGNIIYNATILTMDPPGRIIRDGAVSFDDGVITDLGTTSEVKSRNPTNDFSQDARGSILLPNLVNAHTHTAQTLLKGKGAGLELTDWLGKIIWPLNKIMKPEHMATAAALSAAESLKSGSSLLIDNITTSISEESIIALADTYAKLRMKAVLAVGLTHMTKRAEKWHIPRERFQYDLAQYRDLMSRVMAKLRSKRAVGIYVWPAPITIFSAGTEGYALAAELAREYDVGMHTHIAETKSEVDSTFEDYSCSEVEFLDKLGALSPRSSLAHCIWLNAREIDLIEKKGASIVHCPVSNMYLGDGIADVPTMLSKGINVALGSDGGTCGASHDMFGVMRAAALIHKGRMTDPKVVGPVDVLTMATKAGAKCAGLDSVLGSIRVGNSADMFLVNPRTLYASPMGDPFTNLVYYASPTSVDSVWVSGKLVVQGNQLLTVDEEELLLHAQSQAYEIQAKLESD